jgi:hypothetical protein
MTVYNDFTKIKHSKGQCVEMIGHYDVRQEQSFATEGDERELREIDHKPMNI